MEQHHLLSCQLLLAYYKPFGDITDFLPHQPLRMQANLRVIKGVLQSVSNFPSSALTLIFLFWEILKHSCSILEANHSRARNQRTSGGPLNPFPLPPFTSAVR